VDQVHLLDLRRFRPDKFLPTLVYGTRGARAFLLCLEPGQGLPPRPDSEEVLCYLMEGRARFTRAGEVVTLQAGDLIGAAPGEERGIVAEERAVALWIHIAAPDEQHD
jgi:quercetin dioxygenase-like cupin family protein